MKQQNSGFYEEMNIGKSNTYISSLFSQGRKSFAIVCLYACLTPRYYMINVTKKIFSPIMQITCRQGIVTRVSISRYSNQGLFIHLQYPGLIYPGIVLRLSLSKYRTKVQFIQVQYPGLVFPGIVTRVCLSIYSTQVYFIQVQYSGLVYPSIKPRFSLSKYRTQVQFIQVQYPGLVFPRTLSLRSPSLSTLPSSFLPLLLSFRFYFPSPSTSLPCPFRSSLYSSFPLNLPLSLSIFSFLSQPSPSLLFLFPTFLRPPLPPPYLSPFPTIPFFQQIPFLYFFLPLFLSFFPPFFFPLFFSLFLLLFLFLPLPFFLPFPSYWVFDFFRRGGGMEFLHP